ncbi:hypothetical protein PLESTM_000176900 [Pleodorina starrii]|nr:hypothetical protein PLESTM_000176900 [Pleodorina starrii]
MLATSLLSNAHSPAGLALCRHLYAAAYYKTASARRNLKAFGRPCLGAASATPAPESPDSRQAAAGRRAARPAAVMADNERQNSAPRKRSAAPLSSSPSPSTVTYPTAEAAATLPEGQSAAAIAPKLGEAAADSAAHVGVQLRSSNHGSPVEDDSGSANELPQPGSLSASPPPPQRRPSSSSHTGGQAASSRGIPQAMVVVAQVTVPPECGPAAPLPELLKRLVPEHCPSVTAAKRTLRRRLVLRIPPPPTRGSETPAAGATAHLDDIPPSTAAGPFSEDAASAADGASEAAASGGSAVGSPPHPSGEVLSTTDYCRPGDVLQLLARRGTGIMGWVGAAVATAKDNYNRGGGGGGMNADAAAGSGSGAAAAASLQGLPVAYEDEHLAVVIKPPGIGTQGSGPGTVQGRLKYCLQPTELVGALNRPQQVHRLDAPTGGLLLVAKTHVALRGLAADLHHRRMTKRYCALVKGERSGSGTIDMPLSGKPCVTSYTVVHTSAVPPLAPPPDATTAGPAAQETAGDCGRLQRTALTKISLWPHTGRTHQLRKHMTYTGTPILGDLRYRGARDSADPRVTCASNTAGSEGAGGDGGSDRRVSASGDDAAAGSGNESDASVSGEELWPEVKGEGPTGDGARAGATAVGAGTGDASSSKCGGEDGDADREVHRPPADTDWALAVAAAAAAAAPARGGGGDYLADGSPVSLCLWAVGLSFRHPVTGRRLEVDIADWAEAVYDNILQRDAAAKAADAAAAGAVATASFVGGSGSSSEARSG